MGKKYCVKHNDNVAYCVCKHCPCETLEQIVKIAKGYLTDCQGFKCEAMEEIITRCNEVLKIEVGS